MMEALPAAIVQEGAGHEVAHAEGAHEPPRTIFFGLWRAVKDTEIGHWMGFDNPDRHLGLYWFEAICFAILGSALLITLAFLATRRRERVPRGLQNVMEWAVSLLRSFVRGFMGPEGDRYVPFLGSTFLFIFALNILGIIPAFRAPTMTLSTTAALGITTFLAYLYFAIRDAGLKNVVKHLMGDIWWLAPLMFVVELIGELARPMSLSLRLFGNIFGEDNVIEQLMTLGGWVPIQLPMLAFAIFTSFLQAFIFTALATIYITQKVVHEDHDEGHGHGGEAHAHG